MHNLHFLVTSADNASDACNTAESFISDFGDDNNYSCVEGALSEDNSLFVCKDVSNPRWIRASDYATCELISSIFSKILEDSNNGSEAVNLMKYYLEGRKLRGMDWFIIERFAKSMKDRADAKDNSSGLTFNVLTDSFCEFQYDEFGVSHTGYAKANLQKLYVVFIDMHS